VLQATRNGMPIWITEIRNTLLEMSERTEALLERWNHRLEILSERVEAAIRRAEAGSLVHSADGDPVPWSIEALTYLDHRRESGAMHDCPFPELFQVVRKHHAEVTIKGFHDGLRRLQAQRALKLTPFAGTPQTLPQPEFALPDGTSVLYYAKR
jgi:hypothetical protein